MSQQNSSAGNRTITCTYHCSACGQHFHSLHAFDTHRQGLYASDDPEGGRHCVYPIELDGELVALTDRGECRMGDDGSGSRVNAGVSVWTHADDLARLRDHFASGASHDAEKVLATR